MGSTGRADVLSERCPHGHQNCCGHHDNQDNPIHLPSCLETGPYEFRPEGQPYEEVDHPQHYQLPGGIEVIEVIEDLSYNLGNALKYLLRAGKKPGVDFETDLKKGIWYIEREIKRQRMLAKVKADTRARFDARERASLRASLQSDDT